jgi:hypothetical protein
MNWCLTECNWEYFKSLILSRWDLLSNTEFDDIEIKREMLAHKIQQIYGIKNEQLEAEIMYFQAQNKEHVKSLSK